jgi:polyhydroxybutyrate depolymerase
MIRKTTRRAMLALTLGAGAAALGGCRYARANAQPQPDEQLPIVDPTAAAQAEAEPAAPARAAGRPARPQAAPPVGRGRAAAPASGRSVEQLTVDGVERQYVRYEPAGLDETASVPLVLVLHGRGGTGPIAELLYDMNEQADAHGFVVAYPTALGDPPTWHSGLGMGGGQGDDVAFIRALVEREASRRPLDRARIFVCGHSSGAMMSYRLAGEASDLFPAVGIVAGAVGMRGPNGATMTIQKPDRPVSIIHFHGTADPLVPYTGGTRRGPAGFVPVADSIRFWVDADGCDPTPTTETIGVARRETYGNGRDGSEVTLWTIDGGGHGWPKETGRSNVAVTPAGISATELIWAFFAAHPRGAVSRTF